MGKITGKGGRIVLSDKWCLKLRRKEDLCSVRELLWRNAILLFK